MARTGFNIGGRNDMAARIARKSPFVNPKNAPGLYPPKPAGPKPGLGAHGAAPPAAPAKPKVVGQHMVPDSTYNAVIGHINRGETQQLNQLGGQERQVKFNFGLEDPTNPFSRANALKQAFLSKYKGVSTGLAAQGQLYSGAHERALARTRLQYDQDYAALRQAYDQALGTIGDQMTGVKFASEGDRLQAFQDWLARAPDAQDITAAGPAASPAASPASRPAAAPSKSAFVPAAKQTAPPFTQAQANKYGAAHNLKPGTTVGKATAPAHGGVGGPLASQFTGDAKGSRPAKTVRFTKPPRPAVKRIMKNRGVSRVKARQIYLSRKKRGR